MISEITPRHERVFGTFRTHAYWVYLPFCVGVRHIPFRTIQTLFPYYFVSMKIGCRPKHITRARCTIPNFMNKILELLSRQ